MAEPKKPTISSPSFDPNSGFCTETKTYHSLRPRAPLPPATAPLSLTHYVFSLLHRTTAASSAHPALIDATTRHRISAAELESYTKNLASSLHEKFKFSKGDTAFILSSNSVHIPVLYLSLFSLGVIASPSNPSNSNTEISRQIQLCRPAIAFATSETAHKVPSNSLLHGMVLLDSSEFNSMISQEGEFPRVEVLQSDTAAILCSSGTTGRVKGVVLTHRNIISGFAAAYALRRARASPAVALCTVPYFHTYGFIYSVRAVALGGVVISMERFDLRLMMRAIEEYRVTHVALAPPVIVSMLNNSGVMEGYDLSSLEVVISGGSQLPVAVAERLKREFPKLELTQAYGLTETSGGVSRTLGSEECQVLGSTGRLDPNCEAKVVDPETGIALPPSKQGELWVRGPFIMKGYVDDEEATSASVDSEGWFRTGDLCYFDNQGLLFVVDRIKDLIKYKGYQVAPAELEDVLQSHPDIAEAAVVPSPDEEAGEIPMALVVRRSGSNIAESEIKDFVAKQVAPYKRIRRISFINEIPKNATGKVMRRELRRLAFSGVASKFGFCTETKTYHSLRPKAPLPPATTPLSLTQYVFSLLHKTTTANSARPVLIDATTRHRISAVELKSYTKNLASSLHQKFRFSKGDTAFILSSNSAHIPVLYLSLFSLGVIVSPSNPSNSNPEISRQIQLRRPAIAFATSATAHKVPSNSLRLARVQLHDKSGSVKAVALGWVVVSMERFDLRLMMRAIEEYRVTHVALAPPVIVSMLNNSSVMEGYDLSSLEVVRSGGSQLPVAVAERFKREFPKLELTQAYGLTETSGGFSRTLGSEECKVLGSTGRLDPNCEAKIVDPETGIALPPSKQGELWVRGPFIMKGNIMYHLFEHSSSLLTAPGYVDDKEATAASVDSEGWFRTGDLCYFDNQGFLFVVDRIKDLIKYKGYQVAPAELEDVLQSHPDIAEAAVVPYVSNELIQFFYST
ncbi:hypothetical protein RJ640_030805 [Escallonia rubra]|uniref:4-coumarate--CoA ligase n=1 Tax=Escallonia rubra TaxID=112253 RepID=A0AA88UT07_9ASTE|nr:hypothetical protein RJ640_030805 [Escallonia rubra]